jgi:hypothetical protein
MAQMAWPTLPFENIARYWRGVVPGALERGIGLRIERRIFLRRRFIGLIGLRGLIGLPV